MSRKRTIVIDGELCDDIEEKYKVNGVTWNDVIAHMAGFEDFKTYCKKSKTKLNWRRCDKTLDIFGEENETCI